MKKIQLFILNCLIIALSSCDSFLDIVPDDIATIDNAFTMRAQAEKYLFTCYYYLPAHGLLEANPAIAGGDELYITESFRSAAHVHAWYISHNMQSSARPRCDYWTGADQQNNKSLYQGISDCNIFLENIQKVPDMTQAEKDRWAAEVRFLKVYYHYWLIRMYGPIPIMDRNIPVNASEDEVKVFRSTIDECFDYVINSLTEIINSNHLPDKIMNEAEELGRITQGIAMAIKAEVMVTAASPLFNGNADYKGYTDSRGIELFNPNKSEQAKKQRWIDAAEACRQAIDFLKAQGHDLYKYTSLEYTISDQTRAKMNIRNIVTEKWNQEIIWANSNSIIGQLQDHAIPRGLEPGKEGNASVGGNLAVPLKIADLFYTKNGVPITEDKTWNYDDRFELRKATANDKYFIKEGYTTANLNFDREVRYYASLGFDGTKTDVLTWVDLIRERAGLKGVEESWDTYTNNKKYETIDGRREIIQQERGIELAFEAQRFWDLRRWKLAFQEQNKPITGWNTQYSTNEDYYTEQLIYTQEFRIRNYFWPILDKELYSNKNLVQNYGW